VRVRRSVGLVVEPQAVATERAAMDEAQKRRAEAAAASIPSGQGG
jgi:hypothetical protein